MMIKRKMFYLKEHSVWRRHWTYNQHNNSRDTWNAKAIHHFCSL